MKVMRQRRPIVAELEFSLVKQGALTYKVPIVGLCKLKVQLNHGPQIFHKKRMEQVEKYKGRRGIQ
jgi:hypothetical protein